MKRTILVTMPVKEPHKELLESCVSHDEAEFVYKRAGFYDLNDIRRANIIIGNVPVHLLSGADNLEWLQLNTVEYDDYEDLTSDIAITNARGAYGLAVSEHMLALTFAVMKNLMFYRDAQRACEWSDAGGVTSAAGSTTVVIGIGDIGKEYASRMKALGSYTIGIGRTLLAKPEFLDEMYPVEGLHDALARADIVGLCLPYSEENQKLFGQKEFLVMKNSSILVSGGDSRVIEADDFYDALTNGQIYGAGIDVTMPELFPKGHKLWSVSNLLITPHKAGLYNLPESFERIIRIGADNLNRFFKGEQLRNKISVFNNK